MTFHYPGASLAGNAGIELRLVALQVAELISRYPNLSEIELARLINLYRELSALDMALMISDAELGPKLDNFYRDHRRQLSTPFRQYALLACIAVAGISIAIWAATLAAM